MRLIEPGDTSGLQLLAAGQADFAFSVAESLVPARAEGTPRRLGRRGHPAQHLQPGLTLRVPASPPPKDLQGKTYGGYDGALEKALISKLVACDGGDPSTVTFTSLPGDDFRIGLTEKYYDTAWIFNGWDAIRLREVDALDITTLDFSDWSDCIPNWYTPLIATAQATIDGDPELVRSFLAATAKGYADAMTDPSRAVEALMAAAPELDRDLVTRSADYLSTRYADSPAVVGCPDRRHLGRPSSTSWSRTTSPRHDFDTAAAWDGTFLSS